MRIHPVAAAVKRLRKMAAVKKHLLLAKTMETAAVAAAVVSGRGD